MNMTERRGAKYSKYEMIDNNIFDVEAKMLATDCSQMLLRYSRQKCLIQLHLTFLFYLSHLI